MSGSYASNFSVLFFWGGVGGYPRAPVNKSVRIDDDEIDKRCDDLREKLLADAESESGERGTGSRRTFKEHQVHEMADAKIKESERLRRALRISSDYEEGSHWRRQEERLRGAVEKGPEDEE